MSGLGFKVSKGMAAAADAIAMSGHGATPARIRRSMNEPWSYPAPGTKVLVHRNDGIPRPHIVWKQAKTGTGLPAFMTHPCWVLALSAEGTTWFRGWELTPEISKRIEELREQR